MSTTLPIPLSASLTAERRELLFPTLSPAQIERIAAHVKRRRVSAGEILVEQGDQKPSVFCRDQRRNRNPASNGNEGELITVHTAGQFMGDVGMLSGRRSLVRARMREGGEVVEVNRGCLQNLVQSDADLSEILMRAFIFRRVELIARGLGDVVLLGSGNSAGTLRSESFFPAMDTHTRMSISTTIRAFRKYWTGSKSRRPRFPWSSAGAKLSSQSDETGK